MPGRIFYAGATSFDDVQNYRRAVGDQVAMRQLQAYAVDRIRAAARREDGTLDPSKRKGKLSQEAKTFVVQAMACFDTPSTVAGAVKEEFGETISRQAVQVYDPTKSADADISEHWRQLFQTTRNAFLDAAAQIPISNRSIRLRRLDRMADNAEGSGNLVLAATLLEQAAKEMGNAYTNWRELTDPSGGRSSKYTKSSGRLFVLAKA